MGSWMLSEEIKFARVGNEGNDLSILPALFAIFIHFCFRLPGKHCSQVRSKAITERLQTDEH